MKKFAVLIVVFFGMIYGFNYSLKSGKLDEFLDNNSKKEWVPRVHYYIAFFSAMFGKSEAAISRYGKVVEKYADCKYGAVSQYRIATIYDDLDNRSATIREYEKLIELFPDSAYVGSSQKRLEILK